MARLRKAHALNNTRDWAVARRARTRELIEFGGLVVKARLHELADDNRAMLLGAFLEIADRLRGHGADDVLPEHLKAQWRRRGLRTFDADAAAKVVGIRDEDEEDAMSIS